MEDYSLSAEEVLAGQDVTAEGLPQDEITDRQMKYGSNTLKAAPKKPLLMRIWEQVRDPMILILAVAAIVSGSLGEVPDMCIIFVVIAVNTVLGIIQESKAEAAIDALLSVSSLLLRVMK